MRQVALRMLAMALLASTACGNALGPEDELVYARLHGVIRGASTVPTGAVRLALVWFVHAPGLTGTEEGGRVVKVGQDFPVQVSFPAAFQIDITALPPPEAVFSGVATGTVFVYEDTNGNGALDFTPAAEDAFRDHLLGAPASDDETFESIMYTEQPVDYAPLGFSIFATVGAPDGTVTSSTLPIDTPITLQLSDDPSVSCYLVQPLPSRIPLGSVQVGYTASYCASYVAPEGSQLACGPYVGAPFYQAFTDVPTSPSLKKLCGVARDVCLIPGSAPAELGCS